MLKTKQRKPIPGRSGAANLLAIALLAATGTACSVPPHTESTGSSMPEARTYVFVCDRDRAYTVRATASEAWIFRPEGTVRLSTAPGGQGTRYSDGAFELSIEGRHARFGETGNELQSCVNDPRKAVWERAKLDGADFRAVGNEPGWHLEIVQQSHILLVADYGESRAELPIPEPTVDPETGTTRWEANGLVLEVTGRPCRDSMSGERFESQVLVTWKGRTLKGCGRALH